MKLTKKYKILIPCFMGIGNFIMFLPFIKGVKKSFINSDITLLVNDKNIFTQILNSIDPEIQLNFLSISINTSNNKLKKLFSGFKLLGNNWDIIFCKFGSFRIELIPLMLFGFIPKKIGHIFPKDKSFNNEIMKFFLNYKVEMNFDIHERENYFNLLKKVNINSNLEDIKFKFMNNFKNNTLIKNDYILISPGSSISQSWKRLNSYQWIEIINLFINRDIKVIIISSNDDQALIKKLEFASSKLRFKENINFLFNPSFAEIINLIKYSKMCFCADTYLFHISFLLKKKTCVFLSATKDSRTCYFNKNFLYLRSPYCNGSCVDYNVGIRILNSSCNPSKCMSDISIKINKNKILDFYFGK